MDIQQMREQYKASKNVARTQIVDGYSDGNRLRTVHVTEVLRAEPICECAIKNTLRPSVLPILNENRSPKQRNSQTHLSFHINNITWTKSGRIRILGSVIDGSLKVNDIISLLNQEGQPVTSKGYGYKIVTLSDGMFNVNCVKKNQSCYFEIIEGQETYQYFKEATVTKAINLKQNGGQIVFNKELLQFCRMVDENDFYYVNQGNIIPGDGDLELLELYKLEYQEACYSGLGSGIEYTDQVKAQLLFLATMLSLYFTYREINKGCSFSSPLIKKPIEYAKETMNDCLSIYNRLNYTDMEYETAAILVNILDIAEKSTSSCNLKIEEEIEKLPKSFEKIKYALFSSDFWIPFCNVIKKFCISHLEQVPNTENVIRTTSAAESNQLTEEEQEYLDEYKEIILDGEISDRDRRFLEKIKKANRISDKRAEELESMASPSLTPEEQEYLDEYKEIIAEGEISARDQRFLEKLKKANGISDERAKEIEALA